MNSQEDKKPTYTKIVAICAGVLFFGSILLSVLMATRTMAPPRKYEVDMAGKGKSGENHDNKVKQKFG